jgi:RNA polymerase sigma factor (sigma-70 family)
VPLTRSCDDHRSGLAEGDPIPPEDRLVAGAALSVDQLYSSERPKLLRFLARRTSNDNARDVVQQVFARFIGLDDRRRTAIDNPQAYLRRSAANLVIDQARAADRHVDACHVPADDIDLPGADQLAGLEARDMLHRLEAAMSRLKPRTREIFLAHRIDGYSYGEIAALTGLSVKGVEKHMSRAIAFVDRVLGTR